MVLNANEVYTLRRSGFTEFEIFGTKDRSGLIHAEGQPQVFRTEAWLGMIKQRITEVKRMLDAGMTRADIINFYNRQYSRDTKLSPFDLVDETSPQFMPARKSDYISARQQRAKRVHREARRWQ